MNTSVPGVKTSGQISVEQFARQLKSVFEQLAREGKRVLVERGGIKLDLRRQSA